jgi:SAM-dependent methyltransferase
MSVKHHIAAALESAGSDVPLHRAFVGLAATYDVVAAMQFNLLTFLGLREHHYLLDVGCGSLRAGRLFIPYLQLGHYCGIEPEGWLVADGLDRETGREVIRLKQPRFAYDPNFTLSIFGQQFDFMVAQSIFSHASQSQIRACLSEAAKVLRPEGMFAATYYQGDADYTGAEWVYPGRSTYRPEFMHDVAAEHQLHCVHLDWPHPNGQTWMVFAHRDNIVPDLSGIGRYIKYPNVA